MWIYPITDPKILELKFGSMALYKKRSPEKADDWIYSEHLALWHKQSLIIYLKEPEFKDKDVIYHVSGEKLIIDRFINKGMQDQCSHYYSAQEYNGPIKYVREVTVPDHNHFRNRWEEHKEWQEVDEPERFIIIKAKRQLGYRQSHHEAQNPKYTQFKAAIKSAKVLGELTK